MEFKNLTTVQFQKKMVPIADKIYKKTFNDCEVKRLHRTDGQAHILDQHFAIDLLLVLPSGQWITVQEKFRENRFLKWGDFTQEYKNAVGTKNESQGEWFKLASQLYFYGWASENNDKFEKWLILDVLKYKICVEKKGGIEQCGTLQKNSKHGKANFYGIPLNTISNAIMIANFEI